MKPWLIGVLAVLGLSVMCCLGVVVLGLVSDDATPASAGVTGTSPASGCASTVDQWHLRVEPWGVFGEREAVRVALPWAVKLDDVLRSGDIELNVFNATLGAAYTVTEAHNDHNYNAMLSGVVTERATGKTLGFRYVNAPMDGIVSPVAVIGPEEDLRAHFPNESQVRSLRGLNQFPLDCAEIEGHWRSGFNSIAERYAVSTGQYLGTSTSAAWSDLKLDDGSFTREQNAYVNRVYTKQNDSGSWSHDSWSLTLEPEGSEPTRYKASLIAVQRGFLLWLMNEKFTGDSTEFQRQAD